MFEVLLVLALLVAWRRLDLGTPRDVGLRDTGWRRHLATGLAVGMAGIAVGLALAWVGGGIVPDLRFHSATKTLWKAAAGFGAAVVVGCGEEFLFRGVVLRRVGRDFGIAVGVAVTTAIYAAVHVLRARKFPGEIDAWAGVTQTLRLFAPLAEADALPTLFGLALLGLVLAVARLRTGSLWVSIGIHAMWVAAFRVGRLFFHIRFSPEWLMGPGWPPMVGGIAGWVAVAIAGILLVRYVPAGRKSCL